jgi:long-subunit acyl-CoA synthetase (AMP-forming)
MTGYWRNEKATKDTKTDDGWLLTGDVAFVDDLGKFHVVDRMKVRSYFDTYNKRAKEAKLIISRN